MYFIQFLIQAHTVLNRYLIEGLRSVAKPQTCSDASYDKLTEDATVARKLHIVIGNESCDLDSTVSALSLAFIYGMRHKHSDYVPVLNIPRTDYPLKTEVNYLLEKVGIAAPSLIFRDDLPELVASDFNVILVDHHVSDLAPNVTEIFDHRPLDKNNALFHLLPTGCECHIEPDLGSCATLISERYYAEVEPRSPIVEQLLHATIVLDTINFSPAAKRYSARDLAMADQLAKSQFSEDAVPMQRKLLFDELVAARADVSSLTLIQVLRKDMKTINTERLTVPMAGLPMLVRHFAEKEDALDAVREFADGTNLVVMLGMYVSPTDGKVQRDIGLISLTGQTQLLERVRTALLQSQLPDLGLQPYDADVKFLGGCILRQQNVQATRKHILPLIKSVLVEWEAAHDCDAVYFFKEKPKLDLS